MGFGPPLPKIMGRVLISKARFGTPTPPRTWAGFNLWLPIKRTNQKGVQPPQKHATAPKVWLGEGAEEASVGGGAGWGWGLQGGVGGKERIPSHLELT